ncbi:hypothetical protein GALMADRAFT_145884 [Galerina marginata CBS 339.88]|uniref:DUF6534 domain-containing protein n=1 Tax=Galerina marginata (strain CBS 339.88) TaxID=685588 RepID=A0A067SPY4_GALM3|nr:hypothetical protein GALMADRAFT_145884 [Galerina marginata CBS 339.88]
MVSHGTYTWLVMDFANPLALDNVVWSILAEPLCAATIALCVHLFMAYRIYILNRKLVLLGFLIAVVSFVPFGVGVSAVILGLTTPGGFEAVGLKLHSLTIVAIVFTTSLDIVIAATLVTLIRLHGNNSYLKRTDEMISVLTIYLLTNNLLTSFVTTALLITRLASPRTLVYEAFNLVISKAYTNTFLSQLNARQSIRGRGVISTQGSTNVDKNVERIEFNLRPLSGEELDLEVSRPTTWNESGSAKDSDDDLRGVRRFSDPHFDDL